MKMIDHTRLNFFETTDKVKTLGLLIKGCCLRAVSLSLLQQQSALLSKKNIS